jgi:hypothetical protein
MKIAPNAETAELNEDSNSTEAVLASFEISCLTAKNSKSHTTEDIAATGSCQNLSSSVWRIIPEYSHFRIPPCV